MNVAKELIHQLLMLKDKRKQIEIPVICEEDMPLVERVVYDVMYETNSRIAELEAKVKAYEAIISNSNFNVILQKESENINSV